MEGTRHISVLLAEKITEFMREAGASETQMFAALEIARALVPVLPNASCSPEQNPISEL